MFLLLVIDSVMFKNRNKQVKGLTAVQNSCRHYSRRESPFRLLLREAFVTVNVTVVTSYAFRDMRSLRLI